MAGKTANVTAHVQLEIKQKAEDILDRLGIPVSVLIDSLYRQIIMTNSIPYSLSVPTLPARDAMSVEQFDDMMKKGLDQARMGQGMELDAAFEQIGKSI